MLFLVVFVECRFGRSSGPILSGFGEVFKEIFGHFLLFFEVKRKLRNVILHWYLQ